MAIKAQGGKTADGGIPSPAGHSATINYAIAFSDADHHLTLGCADTSGWTQNTGTGSIAVQTAADFIAVTGTFGSDSQTGRFRWYAIGI